MWDAANESSQEFPNRNSRILARALAVALQCTTSTAVLDLQLKAVVAVDFKTSYRP
jgi:hypothetical protein